MIILTYSLIGILAALLIVWFKSVSIHEHLAHQITLREKRAADARMRARELNKSNQSLISGKAHRKMIARKMRDARLERLSCGYRRGSY